MGAAHRLGDHLQTHALRPQPEGDLALLLGQVDSQLNRVRLPWSDASSRLGDYATGVTGFVNPLLFVGEVELPVLVEVIVGTHGA